VLVSAAAALLAGRITFGLDGWLWNLDTPKIDYPLAALFHRALAAGQLPIWSDDLGLGFPLYAEGQIGTFYPPNWLIFQLEPLTALDLHRLLHLTMAGVGIGLLALRESGSRPGALLAAAVAVLGGAIVTKLEWWNFVAAYAWMPWVFLLVSRRPPRRWEVVTAGALWGFQALAGHPQVWLLTGVGACLLLLMHRPVSAAIGRVLVFGGLGVAVGAMQWIPTSLLLDLSPRAGGLPPNELFGNATTVFDALLPGFANAFILADDRQWDYGTNWYPDGQFPLLNAGLYVGLPALALAGLAIPSPRARRWLVVIGVMLLIPILAAFQPEAWSNLPILRGLRSPVRTYLVVALAIGVLAAMGVSRLGRTRRGWVFGVGAVGLSVAAYLLFTLLAVAAPELFDELQLRSWWRVSPDQLVELRERAVTALTSPYPWLLEVGLALAVVAVFARRRSLSAAYVVVALAILPLALLMPAVNQLRPTTDHSFADKPFVQALVAQDPHRVLTLGPPSWYAGMPDQLAATGVPDISMFSSLNLAAVDRVVADLRNRDPDGVQRRALGVDTVVTFGTGCSGVLVDWVANNDAYVCHVTGGKAPPYWIPAEAARSSGEHATLDFERVLDDAVEAETTEVTNRGHDITVDAPADGWLFMDRAWWPGWSVTVDGAPATVLEASGAQLVAVPAGTHRIVAELTLDEVKMGAAVGLVALVLAAGWVAWPAVRRRRTDQDGATSR
jgi:hypothetical protein